MAELKREKKKSGPSAKDAISQITIYRLLARTIITKCHVLGGA